MFSAHQLLIFAARAGNLELMRERIAAGADVSYQDEQHGSALLVAVASHQASAVELLLSHGSDILMSDSHGQGALEYALRSHDDAIVSVLLRAGARLQPHSLPRFRDMLAQHLKRQSVQNESPG
jgi:ankyrin repeat protein